MKTAGVHHDGSPRYVSDSDPHLGETITLSLWSSKERRPASVSLRTVEDGEPLVLECEPHESEVGDVMWMTQVKLVNPRMHYRWLVTGGDYGYAWLTAAGLVAYDVPDATDFVIDTHGSAPRWALSSVIYQVYPDRFARATDKPPIDPLTDSRGMNRPSWIVPRSWDERPEGRGPHTAFEYFGGDLDGVREHLDYVAKLGATTLYLTPIFPAESTHRYDARSFDEVDPLLGGDVALERLIEAAHRYGLRVVGDITLNHCGRSHPWFERAVQGGSPESEYFYFGEDYDHGYASWWNVPSLPKFNHSSAALRAALVEGPRSPFRRWISGDNAFDGWRVDVANMAGRLGDTDVTMEVARSARRVIDEVDRELLLVAEHGHDASEDLVGDGWHGTMNYAGFTRQVWSWLRCPEFTETFLGLPVEVPIITGSQFVSSIRAFHGRIPWKQLLSSWNILSSHDTARIRTVVGSSHRQIAAMALAIGLPGVPMVFAGDELGEEGWWGEDSRTPFPWQHTSRWDKAFVQCYRDLIGLRTSLEALHTGGLRWLYIHDDALAFVRDLPHQGVLFVVARSALEPIRIPLDDLQADSPRRLFGFEGAVESSDLVVEVRDPGASIWILE